MPKQTRGIVSLYWGDRSRLPIDRLLASTKKYHPNLEHQVIEVSSDRSGYHCLQEKAWMLDLSPFDETLFLDCDTVVMGKLDFGFEKARRHGLAMSICESPWARRYVNLFSGDEIEYNTGVMFFTRAAEPLFERWKTLAETLDTTLIHIENGRPHRMVSNDQGSFAKAVEETGFTPFVLPYNWNFRPSWHRSFFGPIKIWHDYKDPPPSLLEITRYYETQQDHVIQFHH